MNPRHEQPTVTLILRDLQDGPSTVPELEDYLGIHRKNIRPYMKILHMNGWVHIDGWEQRTGPALPVYAYGPGKDKQRPKVGRR